MPQVGQLDTLHGISSTAYGKKSKNNYERMSNMSHRSGLPMTPANLMSKSAMKRQSQTKYGHDERSDTQGSFISKKNKYDMTNALNTRYQAGGFGAAAAK